ncbi:hypothetical protein [Nonomuraea sp. SYSU D8015]|uniref:hypothetical protein n=1 Tax=Nonomuraea sp. SYSU D8015 TaxID=2593644 RepID=UPI0016602C6A|nr:hypothetical protein [Nonomuraea sp. SYSU D8015]
MTIRHQLSILLVLPVATACGLVGQGANAGPSAPFASSQKRGVVTSPSPQKQGVVTAAEAKQILARWDSAEKEAMRQGGTDWTAAEAGLMAEIHKAEVRLDRLTGDTPKVDQERIVKSRFAIPRAGAGTPWFMAEFQRKGGNRRWDQVIFAKTQAGWRMVAVSASLGRVPTPARDEDGFATVLAPDDGAGLVVSPRELTRTHARLLTTAGDDPRANRLILRNLFTWDADTRKGDRENLPTGWKVRPNTQPAQELYALRTTSGSALVWYGITEEDTYTARPGAPGMKFYNGSLAKYLSKGKTFREKAVYKRASMYFAVVPKPKGKVKVLWSRNGYLSATGS